MFPYLHLYQSGCAGNGDPEFHARLCGAGLLAGVLQYFHHRLRVVFFADDAGADPWRGHWGCRGRRRAVCHAVAGLAVYEACCSDFASRRAIPAYGGSAR